MKSVRHRTSGPLLPYHSFDRFFDETFGGAGSLSAWVNENNSSTAIAPPAEVLETPEGCEIVVQLPDVARENVVVELRGPLLTLEAEVLAAGRGADSAFRRYRRQWQLPVAISPSAIHGRMGDGELRLRIDLSSGALPGLTPDNPSPSRGFQE
ncbi:MAG: Hsp20/alpha crystallin family protein [Opitutales bacterium]